MTNHQQEQEHTTDLVVIGSSAGGIEALGVLASTLAADFGSPIVVAQHLDPKRPTLLPDILQRRTSLQVTLVDGTMKLEPGTIYLVPNNRHVAITDGHVELVADHKDRPRPSVDLLLSTAALTYGECCTAVILTGSGSDGAQGAVDVKRAGGTVIVQNPQTARYPSMPLSLPPSIVDFEVDLERIGPLLVELVNGAAITQPHEKTEDLLHAILDIVARQANFNFRSYKPNTILRRISRRSAVVHAESMRAYVTYLETHPEEVGELVDALLINVTHFFRDEGAWDHLRDEVLPDLIARTPKWPGAARVVGGLRHGRRTVLGGDVVGGTVGRGITAMEY
jgi:two-component system CheB/CheR fusion protein